LLTLVSISAILAIEVFGATLQGEYCKILNGLGTTEDFCPADSNRNPVDKGDNGESGESGDTGNPGNGGGASDPDEGDDTGDRDDPGSGGSGENEPGPGDGDNSGDDGNRDDTGGGEGDEDDGDQSDEGNNEPPQEPLPGVITLFQVQAKNNKNHKEVWFTAQFNDGYVENVVLTAYLNGESKVMMRENGNKYRADWQKVTFPAELVIKAHDHEGRYLDAELRYTIRGDENGRFKN